MPQLDDPLARDESIRVFCQIAFLSLNNRRRSRDLSRPQVLNDRVGRVAGQ